MKYKFQIKLNDNDYLEFNKFNMLRSPHGKKQFIGVRISICIIVFAMVFMFVSAKDFASEALISAAAMMITLVVFQLILKKILAFNLKRSISKLRKKGKLLYPEYSTLEFCDEGFIETTKEQRSAQKYSIIERISVVEGKYIYMHLNHIMAVIIPHTVFESSEQYKEFISYMNEKCPKIDFYK